MSNTRLEASKEAVGQDSVIVELVERLLDTTFGLDAAVTLGLIEDYDFAELQSRLMEFSEEVGKIAHERHSH
jgi:hypothetical protein